MRKVVFLVMVGLLILNISGCITATTGGLAGAAGGAEHQKHLNRHRGGWGDRRHYWPHYQKAPAGIGINYGG